MKLLDLRTIFFIAGMLYLLMPLVVWVALREQKSPVVTLWCVGGEVFGMALVLLGLRGHWPDFLTYEVANLALVAGNLTRIQALSTELEKPISRALFIGIPLGFIVVFASIRAIFANSLLPFVFASLLLAFMLGWIAMLAHELADRDNLKNVRVLEGLAWLLMLLLLLRAFEVTSGWSEKGLFIASPIATALTLMAVITSVLANTSFLGLFVERSTRERLLLVREQTRREENDRLSRQIADLDRQRAMGMLSSSLHHELNQPLTNMLLLTERAELEAGRQGDPGSGYARFTEGIQRNLRFALAIIERARGFVKSENIEYRVVSLQEIHASVMAILADWLRSGNVEVRLSQPDDPLRVRGDIVQLSQILVNLYRNAVQACAGQAKPLLAISIGQDEGEGFVRVHDSGPGFSEQSLRQAGTPFFTTKADGLGIGLSIVRNIMQKHRGELKLANAENGGAVVEICLPLA